MIDVIAFVASGVILGILGTIFYQERVGIKTHKKNSKLFQKLVEQTNDGYIPMLIHKYEKWAVIHASQGIIELVNATPKQWHDSLDAAIISSDVNDGNTIP